MVTGSGISILAVSIKDYLLIISDRKTNEDGIVKKGGGLCTYVKNNYICEEIMDMTLSNRNIKSWKVVNNYIACLARSYRRSSGP